MPARPKGTSPAPARSNLDSYFALLIGLFLTAALVKWGRPVILDTTDVPNDFIELLVNAWPIPWAYWLAIPVALLGFGAAVKKRAADLGPPAEPRPRFLRWFWLLPLLWLIWQGVSSFHTVDSALTAVTLKHFAACTLLFYLGYFGLRNPRSMRLIWIFLALGLIWELWAGFEQHFGGLEEQRRYFYSNIGQLPPEMLKKPEFLKKLASDRIYGTFVGYPNTLAGAILLLLPISLGFLWTSTERFTKTIRASGILILAGAGAACLYWSGSKTGWLLALVLGTLALLHAPVASKWKRWLVCGMIVLGLAGFGLRYAGYFKKGATSVAARFDYWRAASVTVKKYPLLGSGPGSFEDEYRQIKPADAEFTRLVHNDYLQQASDSGIPAFFIFTNFIAGSLFVLYRQATRRFDLMRFSVWLGLLGISLHSLMDFHFYVPAMAWTVFMLLGWSLRVSRTVESADSREVTSHAVGTSGC